MPYFEDNPAGEPVECPTPPNQLDRSVLISRLATTEHLLGEVLEYLDRRHVKRHLPLDAGQLFTTVLQLSGGVVRLWWERHCKELRAQAESQALVRIAELDRLRAQGLVKLTPEERSALGLTEPISP